MSHMKAIYIVFAAVLFSISVLANIDIHREEIETLMMGIFSYETVAESQRTGCVWGCC